MLGVLLVIFGLGALVLSPFAFFQVITKAGYSGWWTFVPSAPWIVGIAGAFVTSATDTHRSFGSTIDQLWLWDLLMLLTGCFVMVMFFVFAFSAWPALQQGRLSRGIPGVSPRRAPMQPSWINASAAGAPGSAAGFAPAPSPTQSVGWHRSGAIGAGEQAYWDGQAWTARRQWANGVWVDLPMTPAGAVGSAPVPPAV